IGAAQAEHDQQPTIIQAATRERFAKLTSDTPLWEWWDFALPGNPLREEALAAMRRLSARQIQAETMLEGGFDLPMTEIANLDLDATPALCSAARQFLLQHAASLRPPGPARAPPYAVVAPRLEQYLPGLRWIGAHGCGVSEVVSAYEASARAYPDAPERQRFLADIEGVRR